MGTTPQEIIDAALAKNRKNQPGVIATNEELFAVFKRIYPVFWTVGARVNRTFYGKSSAVSPVSSVWPRPDDAELIFRVEMPDGTKVLPVDIEEKDAEPEEPCVYEWGQSFYPAGNPNDPSSESLTFWYSKKPDAPQTVSTDLEALWPEDYNELLILELALVLALKDEREQEVALLRPDRDAWLSRYIAHLEHATTGVVRSREHNRFQGSTMIPLEDLLAGGTEVSL